MSDDDWEPKYHVYRIFDASDRLLYVGCTQDVTTRIYMHRSTWTMVDAFLIHRHYHRHTSVEIGPLADARAAERKAIKDERPLLNRQHNPTRWRRLDGQYVPVDAETVEALEELHKPPPANPELVAFFDEMAERFRSAH